jgi:hypothetical protein
MLVMRINLVTPFAEKDAVKALGARWDGAKKVWYIVDVSDLTPFTRWIPDLAKSSEAAIGVAAQKMPPKRTPGESRGVVTMPSVEVTCCGCKVQPWAHCEHSAATPKNRG